MLRQPNHRAGSQYRNANSLPPNAYACRRPPAATEPRIKLKEVPEDEDKRSPRLSRGNSSMRRCTNEATGPCGPVSSMAVPGRGGRIMYRHDSTEHSSTGACESIRVRYPLPTTAWPRQRSPTTGKYQTPSQTSPALMRVRSGMVESQVRTGACESIHVRYSSANDGLA